MKRIFTFILIAILFLGIALFSKDGKEVCSELEIKQGPTPKRDACYYNHGFNKFGELVKIHGVPKSEDDVMELLLEIFSSCREIAEREQDFLRCAGGGYNFLSYLYKKDQGFLHIKYDDPLSVCKKEQDRSLAEFCYSYMARNILSLPWKDFGDLISLAEKYSPPQYSRKVVGGTAVFFAHRKLLEKDREVSVGCRDLSSVNLEVSCLDGYVIGLVQVSSFFEKGIHPLNFCSSDLVSDSLKPGCFDAVFRELSKHWPRFFIENSCFAASSWARSFCKEGLTGFVARVWGEGGMH